VQDYAPRLAGHRIIAADRMRDPAGRERPISVLGDTRGAQIVSEEVQRVPFFNR